MTRRDRIALSVVLVVLCMAGALWWGWHTLRQSAFEPGSAVELQEFDVPQGAGLRSVLQELQSRQIIPSAKRFEWYLRCCARTALDGGGIKAGRYRVVPGHTPMEVLEQLVEGRVVMEQVTILPGWTFAQMREELSRQEELRQTIIGRTGAEIMQELGAPDVPAEGRFAPDTYAYAPGVTTDMQVLRMAFEAQRRNLQAAWDARAPDLPLSSPEEALTLASIVEKETGLASERARVAGVFINRLRVGMRLQSDPTVIYGMGDRYDGNIRRRDLTTDTPYNTYTRYGLPPTPIALPARAAIVAALNPEVTDAVFFVAIGDGSGGHYFSATLSEHNRAVERYLQRLRIRTLADEWQRISAEDAPAGTQP